MPSFGFTCSPLFPALMTVAYGSTFRVSQELCAECSLAPNHHLPSTPVELPGDGEESWNLHSAAPMWECADWGRLPCRDLNMKAKVSFYSRVSLCIRLCAYMNALWSFSLILNTWNHSERAALHMGTSAQPSNQFDFLLLWWNAEWHVENNLTSHTRTHTHTHTHTQ